MLLKSSISRFFPLPLLLSFFLLLSDVFSLCLAFLSCLLSFEALLRDVLPALLSCCVPSLSSCAASDCSPSAFLDSPAAAHENWLGNKQLPTGETSCCHLVMFPVSSGEFCPLVNNPPLFLHLLKRPPLPKQQKSQLGPGAHAAVLGTVSKGKHLSMLLAAAWCVFGNCDTACNKTGRQGKMHHHLSCWLAA